MLSKQDGSQASLNHCEKASSCLRESLELSSPPKCTIDKVRLGEPEGPGAGFFVLFLGGGLPKCRRRPRPSRGCIVVALHVSDWECNAPAMQPGGGPAQRRPPTGRG